MIKDLRDWKKESERKNRNKHQWGWFQHPNAGNVEYNIDFFNHVTGADGGDTSVLAGSVGDGGMGESLAMNDTVELYYDDIEVSGYYGPIDWETGYPEKEYNETVSWVYTVDRDDIFVDLEEFIAEESPELSDGQLEKIVSENFEELVDKYYQQLLDKYRRYAEEEANEKYEYDEYDHYLDAISESVNIREALNKIDCNTCGKYDLLNMYDCSNIPVEKKAKLAELLKENVSADKLYEYMDEESPWQIGLELFADNGHEYKVFSVLDEREVDGYELSVVGAIGNELSNADEEVYFVLLDSDIEWGPVDTAEEALEWASDVQDGYYTQEDNFDYDDDYDTDWLDEEVEENRITKDWKDAYRYHVVTMMPPKSENILQGMSNDFDEAERIAINAMKRYASNPWEDDDRKIEAIENMLILDKKADSDSKDYAQVTLRMERVMDRLVDKIDPTDGIRESATSGSDVEMKKGLASSKNLSKGITSHRSRSKSSKYLKEADNSGYIVYTLTLRDDNGNTYTERDSIPATEFDNNPDLDPVEYLQEYYDDRIIEISAGEYINETLLRPSKESIKKACRRGNAMNEGAMKEIDLEVQEAGGVDAYIDSLESQLRNISREMRFLRGQARREMKAGGAYDSVDEINDALRATEKEYNEVRKKYDYISSRQTGGVN